MTESYIDVVHHEDFSRVYNLDDPRSYFRALRPLGYAAPTVMASFIDAYSLTIRAACDTSRLRILDFACGYGPIGALLDHHLTLAELYERFDGDDPANSDADFFEQRRKHRDDVHVIGLDIADRAVHYALNTGLIHDGYSDDLAAGPPSAELAGQLRGIDIVIESGSITSVLPTCFARIIDAAARPPWFIQSPRGDTDPAERFRMFAEHDYVVETATTVPLRYRRLMADEADDVIAATRAIGHDPADHFDGDWFLVPIQIARPRAEAIELPIEKLAWPPRPVASEFSR